MLPSRFRLRFDLRPDRRLEFRTSRLELKEHGTSIYASLSIDADAVARVRLYSSDFDFQPELSDSRHERSRHLSAYYKNPSDTAAGGAQRNNLTSTNFAHILLEFRHNSTDQVSQR